MKQIVLIPVTLILAAVLGYGVVRASGRSPFLHEMTVAMLPVFVAGVAALLPALMRRQDGQLAVVQAGHLGMVLLLALSLALGVLVFFLFRIRGPAVQPYALWLMWFYAVALIIVSRSLIRVIRSTPISPADAPKA